MSDRQGLSTDEPYPFESEDDIEIRELNLEDLDAFAEERVTISELAGQNESWRYGHVIVDEAQDLTAMQWRMIMRRVRGRSLTIVGDLAQRSASIADSWTDLLPGELADAHRQDLTVNYRSPLEIHELAVAVLAEFAPSVAPSRAIRVSGWAPTFHAVSVTNPNPSQSSNEIDDIISASLADVGGLVAVISADPAAMVTTHRSENPDEGRVRFLTPNESKGLEFDGVVLVEPAAILSTSGGEAQLYIALTRATQRLAIVHEQELPTVLR